MIKRYLTIAFARYLHEQNLCQIKIKLCQIKTVFKDLTEGHFYPIKNTIEKVIPRAAVILRCARDLSWRDLRLAFLVLEDFL